MRKGVFIDLDGTLLNDDEQIAPYDAAVIAALRALGVRVYLVTGKTLTNAMRWYDELHLDTILITSLGQVISRPHDPAFAPLITTADFMALRNAIAAIAARVPLQNYLYETVAGKVFVKHLAYSNLSELLVGKSDVAVLQASDALTNVTGCYAELAPVSEEELKVLVRDLNAQFANQFEFSYWLTDGNAPIINIKPHGIGKSVAMQTVKTLDHLDYTISFGNGWNDRNMLQSADLGYAMANAHASVKDYAARVTANDNNHAGVGHALAELFSLNVQG